MEDLQMDSSENITFPVFSNVSPVSGSFEDYGDIPAWLAKASDGYSGENIIKKLQQTKYDRVIKTVICDGMQNLLMNQYTTMILPDFQDDELTLIAARLKTMGLNASAAAIAGECGEILETKKVTKYFTNYVPGTRLSMPNMEIKQYKDFSREKVQYKKPPYNPDNDPFIVQRKIQQLRLHGMTRLRKGLLEIQREQKEISRIRKKSSASDSSNASGHSFPSPRKLQRPNNLRFPSANSLRTDGKLDDFNIKRPLFDKLSETDDPARILKKSSVNQEILATSRKLEYEKKRGLGLEDSMSTDSDSDGHISINSSVFSSPIIAPVNHIAKQETSTKKVAEPIESSSSTTSERSSKSNSSSSEKSGEVEEESEKSNSDANSTASVEEAQFDVVNVDSDSDGSISF